MPYPEAVETDHLSLRRWRSDDGPAMDAIWRERDIWSALRPDIPFDPDAGAAMLNRHVGHWDRNGFGLWAVMERHSDEIIGWVGPLPPGVHPGPLRPHRDRVDPPPALVGPRNRHRGR